MVNPIPTRNTLWWVGWDQAEGVHQGLLHPLIGAPPLNWQNQMWRLPLSVFLNWWIFTKIIKQWRIGIVFRICWIGVIFSMKNLFIGCLKSYFSCKILVKICQFKIEKHGMRQAEYQYMPVPLLVVSISRVMANMLEMWIKNGENRLHSGTHAFQRNRTAADATRPRCIFRGGIGSTGLGVRGWRDKMRLENRSPFRRLWRPVGPLWVQRAFNAASACIPRAIEFCIAMKLPCKTSEATQEIILLLRGLYLYHVLT